MSAQYRAWNQALISLQHNPDLYRIDPFGRLIHWHAYGDRTHSHGWELGHIVAKIDGGSDEDHNIQAEHYESNLDKEAARRILQSRKMNLAGSMLPPGSFGLLGPFGQ
jgi:hypothetical protein